MNILDFYTFGAVIILLIGVGIYKTKHIQSESSYLFAERNTGLAALTATLVMTEFNSATLISFSSLGYKAGFWALIMPAIFLIGILFYAIVVAKKWKLFNGVSVAAFFREKYGSKIGIFASCLLLTAMLGFSATYIKSLILLFHPLFPSLNSWTISAALLGTILAMCLRGGLVSVIRTDITSFVLTLIFIPMVIFFSWNIPSKETLNISFVEGREILPLSFVVSLTVLTMFTYILAPWYGQKIFSAKSPKVAYFASFFAAIIVFLFYAGAIFATAMLSRKGIICTSTENALPHLINQFFPTGFRGFAYVLLFTTSATTLTGVWSAMSAMIVGDFLKTNHKSYTRTMWITVCLATLSYVLANTAVDRVFDKLILANIPVAALSFGLLAGFYWKKASRVGVYLSIIVGCLSGIGAYLFFGEVGGYTWYWAIYGIPLSFFSGMIGSFWMPKAKTKRILLPTVP